MKKIWDNDYFPYVIMSTALLPKWEYEVFNNFCYMIGVLFLFTYSKKIDRRVGLVGLLLVIVASMIGFFALANGPISTFTRYKYVIVGVIAGADLVSRVRK